MRQPLRPAGTAGAVVCAALVLTSCSSGSSGSGSGGSAAGGSSADGVRYAQEQIDRYSQVPAFELEAEPFDITAVAGSTIFNIPSSSQVPYVVEVDAEGAELAERFGATWIEYDNQGSPTQWAAGVEQAVNQDVDLIILSQGVNPSLLIPSLTQAEDAGIPVLVSHAYQNDSELPDDVADLVTSTVDAPFDESGRLSADYAIADTEGQADALVITSSEVPPSDGIVAAIEDEFATHCPDCSVDVVNVPLTDWATKIAGEVQSALQSNPAINYIIPIYDSMSIYAQAGITAAGGTGRVSIATFNGTLSILKMIQDGTSVVMDSGENTTWLAWATFDAGARLITGATPAPRNAKTPLRVFTADNVDEAGTPPQSGMGFGDAFRTGYETLWGVTS
ncbi:substrate-binding domain-containing protein [Modestobacter sp. I12A-02628]|uniref:Sugar ABC transporter substrate-binding protein n=1 Tax=Goekera deserti TaxID=2497753 RepID=A0A7K3WBV1_9ACTN|nr:sugar ABC transporter substrate-binding protein [Goekera deserti]MPQ99125.1 substrate-binding domain-containing protein [Goekera deserti]NDI47459.1 substrate-binding domain-containing protein [Goekera deserti]NEL53270.1 sugar ABC transporter substrate-binding protein [Goekera deserti]